MQEENYLDKFRVSEEDPKKITEERKESFDSNLKKIKDLIELNVKGIKENNGKVLYSFPSKSLVFSDNSDLKKFEEDHEINCGIFQINSVKIINLEETKDGINCIQKFGILFHKNWRDYSFQDENDPSLFKFKESENIPVIIKEDKVTFFDEKKCIFSEDTSFYFVSISEYEMIKNFILDALAYLKSD